ncbi:hypothetical protein BHE74_00005490 [Ensete ventricosum]|nr:hypothetical protein BHE74_00005490 [Ensete ventricosum]
MSGFMFFSNAEREVSSVFHLQNLKKGNPGMSFTDVGRALGERWKKMTGLDCVQYRLLFLISVAFRTRFAPMICRRCYRDLG